MKLYRPIVFLLLVVVSFPLRAGDGFCEIRNSAFSNGEEITLKVFYTVAGAYFGAGEAKFTTAIERMAGKPVYHITGEGTTYGFYDGFFKVRDKYESFIDTRNLLPQKFIRNVYEGGYKKYENVTFSQQTTTAITNNGVFKTPPCVQDVLSSIFYARNIDFSKFKEGDKVPFSMFLDNETYNLYIRYMGKETIKTKFGKFHAIKFKPLLVKGTIFEGGEKMTVWVSDDANHLPLRVESPISVGSIKVDMMGYHGLRYPLTSQISGR